MERSPVYTFTAPRKGTNDESFTFLMTSDMGIGGIHQGEAGSAIDNDPARALDASGPGPRVGVPVGHIDPKFRHAGR